MDTDQGAVMNNSKFHNNGPIGERDYEDNLAQVETRNGYMVSPVQAKIDARESKLANSSKDRFALIANLTTEFKAANGRRPLPREIDAINREANRTLGIK
jgi:hypothetical protein